MFRLNNRQLHIIIVFLIVSAMLLGTLLVVRKDSSIFMRGKVSGLDSFSDGWIASYETLDDAKWRKYGETEDDTKKKNITEVLNLPNSFAVKANNYVSLSHKLPDFSDDKQYMVFYSKNQYIMITVNKEVIYETDEADLEFPFHVVPVDYQYRNSTVTIKVKNEKNDNVTFDEIRIGNYTELLSAAIKENGWFVFYGLFLIILSLAVFVISYSIKTDITKKYMLNYIGGEAVFAGLLFIVESTLFRILIRWELINYFLRSALIIIVSVIHLLVIRSLIKKTRILPVFDIGAVFYGIEFISVVIFAWFRLISIDLVYLITIILAVSGLIIYTMLIGSVSYDYRQRQERPVFISNIILVCGVIFEMIIYITHADNIASGIPIITGSLIYFVILVVYGIRNALFIDTPKDNPEDTEKIVRQQVIESFNPNLLFASFQTLQSLIKNGSENSTKMIYYISVYVMNNLKAISSRGEIIPFNDELEHIMAYLNLQRTRNNRFSFVLESKVKDFKIPRNTIEPLVENAVKYGIAGKNNTGNVVLRSYTREDGYAIQIIDNGIGFDDKNLKKTSPTSIKSLFELLEDKCQAKTEIISKEGKGTVITIILPMIENELL